MSYPTLSVLLPTLNDGYRLGVQLSGILDQLTNEDEIVLLTDGSDDLTRMVARSIESPIIRRLDRHKPSGVCNAYNLSRKRPRKTGYSARPATTRCSRSLSTPGERPRYTGLMRE